MYNFDDVYRMHKHFTLPIGTEPALLNESEQLERESFIREELMELEADYRARDLAGVADALIDIVFMAMGTAVMMGLPWQALWDDVVRANLAKISSTTDSKKLIKPDDWVPPQTSDILFSFRDGVPAPTYSKKPHVVCLCGSTKFKDAYEYWNRHFTLKGHVVLTVGFFFHGDGEVITETKKAELDQLHLHKIDMADAIFVLNVAGYIGESTAAEIKYATSRGKDIQYLDTFGND